MALQTVGQHLENVRIPLTLQTVHLLLDNVRTGEDNECDLRRSEESNFPNRNVQHFLIQQAHLPSRILK